VRDLLAFEVARTRALYAAAEPGIELLHPTSRDCIRTAFELYGGILDAVEKAGYQVLDRRVAVPLPRRLAVALPALVRARKSRR
jgi:phytoene synthase